MTRGETLLFVDKGAKDLKLPMGHRWDEAESPHGVKLLRCPCGTEWDQHRRSPAECVMEDKPPRAGHDQINQRDREQQVRRQRDLAIAVMCKEHPEIPRSVVAERHGTTRQWVSKVCRFFGVEPVANRAQRARYAALEAHIVDILKWHPDLSRAAQARLASTDERPINARQVTRVACRNGMGRRLLNA